VSAGDRARQALRRGAVQRMALQSRLTDESAGIAGRMDLFSDAHHATRSLADQALAVAEHARLVAEGAEQAIAEQARQLDRIGAIDALTSWIEAVEVPETTLVSVVMPTHNRADLVPRALASVLAQSYGNWEALVVDDGSTDETAEVLAGYADEPRIKVHRTLGIGSSGARNVALAAAAGDVVVYLDDDNVFDPMWFKAVVWAFGQRPEVNVLYAARVIDDLDRVLHRGVGHMPIVHFLPWNRAQLEQGMIADMGVMAHRSGLPEASFDERLNAHNDWDFFLRLTQLEDPLELPVIALYYASDSPHRLSDGDTSDQNLVRQKLEGT
jgi:glycosyl transferase family 2